MAHNLTSHARETIFLNQPRKKKELSPALKFLTSPKLTVALGATLIGLLNPAAGLAALKAGSRFLIPKTLKQAAVTAIAVPTIAGVLSRPKGRKAAAKIFSPGENIKRGQNISDIITGDKKAIDVLGIKEGSSLKEKVVAGLKAAGLVGAAAAVGIGGAVALKKGKQILDERAAKKAAVEISSRKELSALGFTDPQPVGLGGIPVGVPIKTLTEPPGSTKGARPIQNIIQIQVQ